MKNKQYKRPWVVLSHRIEKNDTSGIIEFLNSIAHSEKARILSRLNEESVIKLLSILPEKQAAELLMDLPIEQAAGLIEHLEPHEAAAIVDNLPPNIRADILHDVTSSDSAQAILETMAPEDAQQTREMLQYKEDTAGGIMRAEFLAYNDKMTVEEVTSDMEKNRDKYSDYNVQYAYVVDSDKKLTGVLRLRDLLLSPRQKIINEIMKRNPLKVDVSTPLERLIETFEEFGYLGVPVVDNTERLVGIASRYEVVEAAGTREKDTYLKASGIVGGEELRSMPFLYRTRRRLSWLSVNILLNILAASVIAFYQDTLAAVIALAVFLPIISDMSGCSGFQAVAVSIRELTLGVIKPADIFRVLFKECFIGIVNGIILGIILGFIAFLWKGNIFLAIVVGGALAINTLLGVIVGGTIPLVLKKMGKDPALASGPILTTITDMCGFFFVLSFATLLLSHLKN